MPALEQKSMTTGETPNRLAAIRHDFPILQRPTSLGKRLVYLDAAATAQKPQVVIERLARFYREENANIHRGVYELAEQATALFEEARATIARFLGASDPSEIVWTRNATEAINVVAHSWGGSQLQHGDTILLSELEHHANLVPWQMLAQRKGLNLRFIPIDASGQLRLDELDHLLEGVKLVGITQVSNTLGTITPLEHIIERAHRVGAVVLVDGAQAVPHRPVDVQALQADFYVASGHKMGGPTGIGFLWGRRELLERMPPFLGGGDMIARVTYQEATYNDVPWRFEAGTSDFADAVALATAVEYLSEIGMPWIAAHERRITAYALERLARFTSRGLRIYGPSRLEERAGVISFTFADIHPHDLASLVASDGVCIRAGHHCTMPLMDRLGLSATARASFALHSGEDDVDALVESLEKAARIFGV